MSESEEKAQKLAQKSIDTITKAARLEYAKAIGLAVVELVKRNEVITVESLILHLQDEALQQPHFAKTARREAAEKALLEAQAEYRKKGQA